MTPFAWDPRRPAVGGSRGTIAACGPSATRTAIQALTLLFIVTGWTLSACATMPRSGRDTGPGASGPETDASARPSDASAEAPAVRDADLEIVDIIPKDAIPAIDRPEFWTVEEADRRYQPEELVLGVAFEGEARAYSVPFLSRHEIVNDTVGGRPISVTW